MLIGNVKVDEELLKVSQEIKDIVSEYQEKNKLSFIEDTHTYYIKDENGKITSDFPSVSTVLKAFYGHFDATTTRKFKNCGGDPQKEKELLTEWKGTADYATNMGSRAHFLLEEYLVGQYGAYKEVRLPIFNCDKEQIETGDAMIKAGKEFLELMHKRGAVLLDTEMVLGSSEFKYTGQPDKAWIMRGKNGQVGLVVTDYKTNKPKNFVKQPWTTPMLPPFDFLDDTALGHYYVQIPLYAKLLLKMLEGTKYENLPFFGGVVLLLKKEGVFEEYRIPQRVIDIVMEMDVQSMLNKRKDHIKRHKWLEARDERIRNL